MTLHTITPDAPLYFCHVTGSDSSNPTFQAKLHDVLTDIQQDGWAAIVDIRFSQSSLTFPNGEGWTEYSALIFYR